VRVYIGYDAPSNDGEERIDSEINVDRSVEGIYMYIHINIYIFIYTYL
jgi:hypothetical protein